MSINSGGRAQRGRESNNAKNTTSAGDLWLRRPTRGIKIESYIQTGHNRCHNIQAAATFLHLFGRKPGSDNPSL